MKPDSEIFSPGDIARSGLCIGCGACSCANAVQLKWDRFGQYKPAGPEYRRRSERFSGICPFSPASVHEDRLAAECFPGAPQRSSRLGSFRSTWLGSVEEGSFREGGSSGGLVSWTLVELLKRGLVDGVAHVVPGTSDGMLFHYRISRTEAEIRAGAKSRYYPVEMSGILRQIQAAPGRYAVVGVPCFIKAVRLLCRQDEVLRQRIVFTLGLFCGHMKSARFAESLAWQMDCERPPAGGFDFRVKDVNRPAGTYTAAVVIQGEERRRDWWNMPDGDWGAGFFQNSACNFCDDIVGETADASFGDAWVAPYASDGRGTNVLVVRSEQLEALFLQAADAGRLSLSAAAPELVEKTQEAAFRQRREGLAYRLCWSRTGVRPRKRVHPSSRRLGLRRKAVYRIRAAISFWSHRIFWCAQLLHWRELYLAWARGAAALYGGAAYLRGRTGTFLRWAGWR